MPLPGTIRLLHLHAVTATPRFVRRALLAVAILIVPTIGRAKAAPLGEVLVLATGSTIASRVTGCLVASAAISCSVDAADVQR